MKGPVFFYCDYDGNPLTVSCNDDGGLIFAIDDCGDNNQSRQVRMSLRDQKKLAEIIRANLARFSR